MNPCAPRIRLQRTAPRSLDWQERALCADLDPELFYPAKGECAREAKAVCAQCPVRLQCLEYAIANDEKFGIFGGLSERERRVIRKERRSAALSRTIPNDILWRTAL